MNLVSKILKLNDAEFMNNIYGHAKIMISGNVCNFDMAILLYKKINDYE